MPTTFQVDKTDLHATRSVTTESEPLDPGQVRFRIESFALTANNVTYASAGSFLGYWDFYPATDPWGQIPAMGHAQLVESTLEGLAAGGRYFGFFPMSDEVVIEAEVNRGGIWAAGPHRAQHAPAYRQFTDLAGDPSHDPAREDQVALLRGLFMTSFLAEDMLDDADNHCAEATVITSASAKTSIALAWCVRDRGTRAIGLTSAPNRDFVVGLGCYDQVATYDDIESLDGSTSAVVVDMAGDRAVLGRVHEHYGASLAFSLSVGATHHDAERSTDPLPGPAPEFFFAPGQIEKRNADWGPGQVMARMGTQWARFVAFTDDWLQIVRVDGPDAIAAAYDDVLNGRRSPADGLICSL